MAATTNGAVAATEALTIDIDEANADVQPDELSQKSNEVEQLPNLPLQRAITLDSVDDEDNQTQTIYDPSKQPATIEEEQSDLSEQ